MVQCAKYIAMQAHSSQRYGEHPYIHHLEAVEQNVISLSAVIINKAGEIDNSDILIYLAYLRTIAWLHDVIEDTTITADFLFEIFPAVVVNAVETITKYRFHSYEDYIKQVRSNTFAHIVKIADTEANLKASLATGEQRRIDKYTKQLELLRFD